MNTPTRDDAVQPEDTMTDTSKLSALLDDPEVHELIFGLAHVDSAPMSAEPGASRLRAVVLHLAHTTDPEQYSSWLSDDTSNQTITLDQVRVTIGDGAINDLALFAKSSPSAVIWQLAAVLPDLVDAVTPGGEVIDTNRLSQEIAGSVVAVTNRPGAGSFLR